MKKKIIAFALVLLLLTGCSARRGATLLHDGAPVSVETLLWIDSSPISLDLYRYYFCTTRAAFDGGDSSYWDTHLSEEPSLLSQTLEALRAAVALERFAEARGLSLSEEEEKSVEDSLKKAKKAAGGESAFLLSLEKRLSDRGGLPRPSAPVDFARKARKGPLCRGRRVFRFG